MFLSHNARRRLAAPANGGRWHFKRLRREAIFFWRDVIFCGRLFRKRFRDWLRGGAFTYMAVPFTPMVAIRTHGVAISRPRRCHGLLAFALSGRLSRLRALKGQTAHSPGQSPRVIYGRAIAPGIMRAIAMGNLWCGNYDVGLVMPMAATIHTHGGAISHPWRCHPHPWRCHGLSAFALSGRLSRLRALKGQTAHSPGQSPRVIYGRAIIIMVHAKARRTAWWRSASLCIDGYYVTDGLRGQTSCLKSSRVPTLALTMS